MKNGGIPCLGCCSQQRYAKLKEKKNNMQVIGIDPGLINTGWAVIEEEGPKIKYLGSGICKTGNKTEMTARLY